MRIRRVDIVGFKSFTERTRLRFEDGITGIVGPNGCGKSNIVDAIRWVMGEQSSRVLRGKAMEDVIFAGSQTKPPMGMSEVEITFENDGRHVPPEYVDLRDISVSRRLFRSGESEYLINRTPCRLLDVQELFMGTGVGTKAYSIIGQGQIGLLVSQKPAERRVLVEEAAGISKYKARKRTAERKMEQTRQNLLRVADVTQEIRRNMGSLKRQARKAARFHKLADKLREIELHSASHRYLEISAVARHLKQKHRRFADRESALQSQLARLDASVEKNRLRLLDEERSIAEMQEALLSTDNQIKLNEQNIEFLSREVRSLSDRGQASAQEIESLLSQRERLAAEIGQAERELAEQVEIAENAAYRLAEREGVHKAQARTVERLDAEADEGRQNQLSLRERGAELRSTLANLDRRLLDLEGRLGQARAETSACKQQARKLEASKRQRAERLAELQQLKLSWHERREFVENSLAETRSLATAAEAKAMALREEIGNKRSRLESLKEIERNYEGCLSGVRRVMQNACNAGENSQVLGLVADIIRAPPRVETAVQAVLGERLQSVVVRSQQIGLDALDTLKREAEGRSSFIPLDLRESAVPNQADSVSGSGVVGPMAQLVDYDETYSAVVRYLLGDVVVVEDLSRALSIWSSNGHRATLVTLDGEVLEPQGVLTGGSLEGPSTHLLQNKREIRELSDRLTVIEAEYRLIQDQQSKLKTQNAKLAASIESLKQSSHDEEIRIVDKRKDIYHLTEQLSGLDDKIRNLKDACLELEAEMQKTQSEQEEARQLLSRIEAEQADHEAAIRQSRASAEQHKRSLAGLSQEVTELKVQAAAAAERQESARRNVQHLVATREDLHKRIERLRTEISDGNQQSLKSKEKIDSSQQELSELVTQREQEQAELSTRREAYECRLAEARAEEVSVKQLRAEWEAVGKELSEIGMGVREIEMDREHLIREVRHRHRVELPACLSAYHLLPPPGEEEESQAEKLRRDLERMGDVNPHAVEQYEELKQRYEFLSTQSQDLAESLEKLTKVIQKINRTSRKRFREAFFAIDAKFQEVFPRLFNGGRARLILDEDQDLLEAGVDIVVQPPGKKLSNIELLSGGEKALTAVALLFAIFLVKPTPFCLLDEVDAPLDDINIERFNAMVEEMSKSSQFIIITHNKRTMELLHRLYGITMEEPGISTVVSVQLGEKDSFGGDRPIQSKETLRRAG